jgi:hypothetical protein
MAVFLRVLPSVSTLIELRRDLMERWAAFLAG